MRSWRPCARKPPADLVLSASCLQWLRDPARRFLARYEALRDAQGVPLTYMPVFWVAARV